MTMTTFDAADILTGEFTREARLADSERAALTFSTIATYIRFAEGLSGSVDDLLHDVELFTRRLGSAYSINTHVKVACETAVARIVLLQKVLDHA
ncbi:hypothetical protein [Aeromicrobium sp. 179-A 4D2 NHS]|uniref:hypothetical protein n=1 Tax=Aeromicrobium sp. 179-A 4D2 NHS TaxID=3142375 RepID=UPI0039A01D00